MTTHAFSTGPVDYRHAGRTYEGYLVLPDDDDRERAAVIICHDWSGLNDSMKARAHDIAGLGYPCLAIDIYGKGVRGEETGDNTSLMQPLRQDRTELLRRLVAGLDFAASLPQFDADRIAALGYCFGGLSALDLARSGARLKAAISVHGAYSRPSTDPVSPIHASILILHGWADPMAPPQDVVALAEELTEAGADWQLHAYGHALHAFTAEGFDMPERGVKYDPRAAERSWQAIGNFLHEVMGR